MNDFELQIKDKHVLIFGLGRQGGGSGDLEWLKKHGAITRVSDRDLTLCPEGQTREQIDWAEIIIKNPGVSDTHELVIYAKSKNIPVYTSIALFVKYAGIKTIGVTGTRGKSTTVALITALLESVYPDQIMSGGNIAGTSGLSLFDKTKGKKYAVLELSSFQLHNFHDLKVSPNIAVITNLYPDHLNRYANMDDYRHDKEAIVMYQQPTDVTIWNKDNPGAFEISKTSTGQACWYSSSFVKDWQTPLPGDHNKENIAAMLAVAQIIGINEDVCKKVASAFKGVPFRQEKIREWKGITFINDTTSTTPTASIKALKASSSPTIWITGGDTKKLPFEELLEEVRVNKNLKNIVILGSKNIPDYTTALVSIAKEKIIGTATSIGQAIELCLGVAKPGDNILLSPGFASFDLFENEFDRGRKFNEYIKNLQ